MKLKGILLLALVVAILLGTTGCTQTSQTNSVNSTPAGTPVATVTTATMTTIPATPVPVTPAEKFVRLETTMGNISIELASDMPVTTGNFASLVQKGFYDGVIFHRVIDGFMIQGGDPTGTGYGGPGYTISDEFSKNLSNVRGTIAMANAGPNTGGSQFFINLVNNTRLDSKHPVFGKVIDGMDVVDAIGKVQTDSDDRPVTNVTIVRAVLY
ncbi:MAG: peptidylprolyl isomerase [Methanoregulaceae archaeon]